MSSKTVRGDVLIELLLAASPGESILVGTTQWTSLDDGEFEVAENGGEGEARLVTLDDDQVEIDPSAEYDVVR